jgi:ABC-type branched-subunit amino acid transport system substrate-binding protein
MPRHGRRAAALAAAVWVLAACTAPGSRGFALNGSSGRSSQPPGPAGAAVRIGVVTDLTGADAQLGMAQRQGAELAVRELGGRAGNHRVSVVVADDRGRPDLALARAAELVKTGHVDVLTGCVSAATGLAVNQAAKEAGVPYLATCQTDQLDRPPDLGPATFGLAPLPEQVVSAVTPWVLQNLGRRLLFLEPEEPWGHQQYDAFDRALRGAGAVVEGTVWVPPGKTDFASSYLPRLQAVIQAVHPDVLVVGLAGRDQGIFLQQARQFGLDPQTRIFEFLSDTVLDDQVGFAAVAGTYAATSFLWSAPDAGGQRFARDYQAAYGWPPGAAAAAVHDAVTLVAGQVAADRYRPSDLAGGLSGMPVHLSGGAGFIRACDHQAFLPTYIVQGLSQAEAAARGGSARYGYRAVVATIPPDERQGPSCADLGLH